MMRSGLKISIVDDNKIFRDGLRFFIENNTDWEIICEASSGIEFIEKECDDFPDIVLMDINMPGLNGIDSTFQYISKHSRFHIKVIALTMYAHDFHIQSFMEAGIKGCILKKDVYAELKVAVEKVMKNGVYYSSFINSTMK